MHGDRQYFLRPLLPYDIIAERLMDLLRCRKFRERGDLYLLMERVGDYFVAEFDSFIAYVHRRSGDKLFDLIVPLAAERTL